jgi:ABC-type sugar transport system ATPase subunit
VPPRAAPRGGTPRLEARGLTLPGEYREVSFQLQPGEILGLAGLQGSGRAALVRSLFGAPPPSTGQVLVEGRPVALGGPRDAMAAGIGYVPEDRKTLGLFDDLDVKANVGMASLDALGRGGFLDRAGLRRMASQMRDRLSIKVSSVDAPLRSLSGGNQQKVLIARWLALRPRILLMSEPTRGVDVGAKREIVDLIQGLAAEGCAVVVSASELDELLELSSRVLVMSRGRVARELRGGEATKDRIILAATT